MLVTSIDHVFETFSKPDIILAPSIYSQLSISQTENTISLILHLELEAKLNDPPLYHIEQPVVILVLFLLRDDNVHNIKLSHSIIA